MWRKDNIYSRHGEKTIYTLILQQDTRLLYGYVPKIHVLHAWRKNNIYTNFSQPPAVATCNEGCFIFMLRRLLW